MSLPNLISIQDRGDRRVAPFVSIRERDLTGGTDGRFIVEGKVPLSTLLTQSRFEVESLFLCETRLEPLGELLTHVPLHVPIYVAPQDLMDEIAGFPIHRGVLACAKKGAGLALDQLIKPADQGSGTLLVLNQLSNHDNVGAAFRNAAAFGADGVILDIQSCDPLYRKAIRVSSGSTLWLPFVRTGTGEDHIRHLKAAGYTIWAMTPDPEAAVLSMLKVPNKLAILLGAEGPGLPDMLIKQAAPVRLSMIEDFDSINVATAGAIALSTVFNVRQMG